MDLTKDEVDSLAEQCHHRYSEHHVDLMRFAALCRADLVAEVERLTLQNNIVKEERDNLHSLHESVVIEIGKMCGEDLIEEPRAKWALLEVAGVVRERDDWKARALKAEQAGEPVGIPPDVRDAAKSMKQNGYRGHFGLLLKVIDFVANYTSPLQPAAQEPTSAVPVVEQLVEALQLALAYWKDRQRRYRNRAPVWVESSRAAIATGQKFIKENGK